MVVLSKLLSLISAMALSLEKKNLLRKRNTLQDHDQNLQKNQKKKSYIFINMLCIGSNNVNISFLHVRNKHLFFFQII